MKRKIKYILFCITILFLLIKIPLLEVKSVSYGTVSVGTKIKENINLSDLDNSAEVWELYVDNKTAFCAQHGVAAADGAQYTQYEGSKMAAEAGLNSNQTNIIFKAVNWYSTLANPSNNDYSLVQIIVWGAIHKSYTDLNNETVKSYLNTAMSDIVGSGWSSSNLSSYITAINSASNTSLGIYYYVYGTSQPIVARIYAIPNIASVEKEAVVEEKINIELTKTDDTTKKPLANVTFSLYRDNVLIGSDLKTNSNGELTKEYSTTHNGKSDKFKYCSNWDSVGAAAKTALAADGVYASKAEAETAAFNQAKERANAKLNANRTYKVVETKAKSGYWVDSTNNTISKIFAGNKDVSLTLNNQRQTGTITITKLDEESKKPLSGVVFELYANEDIVHPDGSTGVVYKKDAKVDTFDATNSEGVATIEGLFLGKYYIKEITPPTGYKSDDTKHEIELTSTNSTSKIITKKLNITNGLVSISLKKVDGNGKKNLEGVKFELYANQAILKADGSVAYKKDELVDTFPLTDEEGETTLSGLVVGKYYIKEVTTIEGYALLTKKIEVSIEEDGKINVSDDFEIEEGLIVIKNKLTKISISKQDMATTKELSGATISICQTYVDEHGKIQIKLSQSSGDCVEAELGDGTKLTWVSTDKPYAIEGLSAGTYYLVEKIAPNNYSTAESILFTLKEDGTLVDKDGKSLKNNKLVMFDAPIKNEPTGSLSIYLVISIIVAAGVLGIISYLLIKKYTNKN